MKSQHRGNIVLQLAWLARDYTSAFAAQNPANELFQLSVPLHWVSACDSERNHERSRSGEKMCCVTDDRCQGGSCICRIVVASSRIRVATSDSRQVSTACSGILRLCGDGVMQGAVYPRFPRRLECLLEVCVCRWSVHCNFMSRLPNLMVPEYDPVRNYHLMLISSPDFNVTGASRVWAMGCSGWI